MSDATNANVPAPSTPFVGQSGMIDSAWFRFLVALYNRSNIQPTGFVVGPSHSTDLDIPVFSGTTGALIKDSGIPLASLATNTKTKYTKGATWDGGLSAITAPATDVTMRIPVAGAITGATMITHGGTGSCVVDVWKTSYTGYPPTVANSITASALPTISSGIKYQDLVLPGWATSVAAGDVLTFHLVSASVFAYIHIDLDISP